MHYFVELVSYPDEPTQVNLIGNNYQDSFVPDDSQLEIMQYTGIKDSKGQEIFEGDIIKVTGMYGKIQYAKVIWGPVNNMYTWMNGETWLLHFSEDIKGPLYPYCQRHHGYEVSVVGNIYENTELLKEGKV
jgi:uncharacterized phage protein (TIGR01671 family)